MNPILAITDGTTRVSFFGKNSGYRLQDWKPSLPEAKDGGIWQQSPFAQGRRIVMKEYGNVIDTFILTVNGFSQDAVIRDTQTLRQLLEKAVAYWTTSWQNEPVWIEAQGDCESNPRYAIIYDWKTPSDANPFSAPFSAVKKPAMPDWTLIIEHGIWQDVAPGQSTCLPISAGDCYNFPSYYLFDALDSRINCGSPAKEDNLADNAFTAEAWIYPTGYGENNAGRVFDKTAGGATGWYLAMNNATGLDVIIYCAVANGTNNVGLANISLNAWHHIALVWDDAVDRKPFLYLNGVLYNAAAVAGNGAIVADAANDLYIGNRLGTDRTFEGRIGWTRISNVVRYAFPFTPPERCQIPDIDANTVWLGLVEGQGTVIYDRSNMAVITNGALTAGVGAWGADCCD